jgi:serine/threonine-protein kinase RsbW
MRPDAEIRVPADPAYVAVLRMAASGIAARLDFTLDDVEDLRMAVSEACAIVLADVPADGRLSADFVLGEQSLQVRVAADSPAPVVPDPDSFAWQVLTTTADDVSADATEDQVAITLTVSSTSSASA